MHSRGPIRSRRSRSRNSALIEAEGGESTTDEVEAVAHIILNKCRHQQTQKRVVGVEIINAQKCHSLEGCAGSAFILNPST